MALDDPTIIADFVTEAEKYESRINSSSALTGG
jgi:hypothetical protein